MWFVSPTPRHGVDGWSLEDMDWDPETGTATFEYSNIDGRHEVMLRAQPTLPEHKEFFHQLWGRKQPGTLWM
jgi:hypothetical protein